MFHSGDLQSGISRAITEQKLVAVFIYSTTDSNSQTWEQEYLCKEPLQAANDATALGDRFAEKAVMLKIEYGSQEAGFLSAFCPITAAPTFVVIHNGRVLEKVEGEAEREEFENKISAALGLKLSDGEAEESQSTQTEPAAQLPAASGPSATTNAQQQQRPQPTPATEREAAEKAAREARTNARRKEAEEAHVAHQANDSSKSKEAARRDWLVQQKKRQDEAKGEKQRILAQIEADKAERKARFQRAPVEAASTPLSPSADAASRRTGAGGMCSLQIRLFDGTSIKGRFEPSATLSSGVRDWIKDSTSKEARGSANGADIPYTFKLIRAPQPSRSIEISEEHQSLYDLGLTPNATLVLQPVSGFSDAYSTDDRGYVSSALNLAYGAASKATGVLSSALAYVPGFGPATSADDDRPSSSSRRDEDVSNLDGAADDAGSSRIKVRSLADQRADAMRKEGKKTEFYNGNSSAFEGRKDDDHKK
ncbi:uncharacterized protein MYCGRDRAFT_51417 [Zymoseptoria tritici IPO323]|uniref:UBX domain-containing protein 2 n=1 Tax=Zymoseptoria tritici (strain CBS 115943 / IPO323) TaxID=336722 RepID=F9XQ72_ZYMTI|nr:uncharacterized protein MYCGRDRAFT_51417 [Zymoseptoria tritici IPO323]EGP82588.1 hypothetical protein MYCGRDRAFT_51417 [Zymoseptoria tritici IPO323]